ncbi:MAG: hypothetical protein WC238_00135 [Parcubacteria group bacterium]|jgi:hypothetical protein
MSENWPKTNTPDASSLEKTGESGEQKNIAEALKKIDGADIFDKNYLEKIKIVVFGYDQRKVGVFENGSMHDTGTEEFSLQDFMQGKRTDFVGIHPKSEFMELDLTKLADKQFLPFLFFDGKLQYEELVVHEMAHTLFDLQYKAANGDYEDRDGLTDVSEKYREYVVNEIKSLFGAKYPKLELDNFSFSRQQIAEIFAFAYQREYCNRSNENMEVHVELQARGKEFLTEPEKILADFNKKNERNCSMTDFYEENHILSLLVVPLLEEKYPNFKERIKFFNL